MNVKIKKFSSNKMFLDTMIAKVQDFINNELYDCRIHNIQFFYDGGYVCILSYSEK